MKLLIKQRVFSWTDSYDIYDETQTPVYFVEAEFFTFGHVLHAYSKNGGEVGCIRERILTFLPKFEIYVNDRFLGVIRKEFTFFSQSYSIDYNGWEIEGDIFGWDYDINDASGRTVAQISKKLFNWGDTYELNIINPEEKLSALMTVIAIDAANCGKRS